MVDVTGWTVKFIFYLVNNTCVVVMGYTRNISFEAILEFGKKIELIIKRRVANALVCKCERTNFSIRVKNGHYFVYCHNCEIERKLW